MMSARAERAGIVVIGVGAIGTFLAARLHLAGQRVALTARGEHLVRLRRDGLRLDLAGTPARIDVPVAARIDGKDPARLVLLCTKMGDLGEALDLAEPVLGPDTALLTVQNGVEAPSIAQHRFPDRIVLASRIHGFFERNDGVVRHVGVPPSVELGPVNPQFAGVADRIADLFDRAGVPARCVPDIHVSLWSKFLLTASLGGVALAYDMPAGQVPRDPAARAMLETAMTEVRDVAAARGIALPDDIVRSTMAFVASFPADATTSLQRDIMLGRASEYDFLPGAARRLGREYGVPTPCFDVIDRLLAGRAA